jgi:hypothetical protein
MNPRRLIASSKAGDRSPSISPTPSNLEKALAFGSLAPLATRMEMDAMGLQSGIHEIH